MESEEAQDKDRILVQPVYGGAYFEEEDGIYEEGTYASFFNPGDTEVVAEGEEVFYVDASYAIDFAGVAKKEKKTKKKKKGKKKKHSKTVEVLERTSQHSVVEDVPQKNPSRTPPEATKDEGIDAEGPPVLLETGSRTDQQALLCAIGQLIN